MNSKNLQTYQKDFLTFCNAVSPLNQNETKQANMLIEELENLSIEEFTKRYNLNTKGKVKSISICSTPLSGSQGFLNSYKNYRKSDVSEKEWKHQYQQEFLGVEETSNFKDTKRKDRIQKCGDCTFFGDKGCTTSYIEAKWGTRNTPACSEFSPKIFGTKVTLTIIDDIETKKG